MKIKSSIVSVSLAFSMLWAAVFFLGIPNARAAEAGTVTSKGKTVGLAATYEGTATHYNRRTDPFSVGYYVRDGVIIGENSLLADTDTPVSRLALDIAARGEGFNAVIATGKNSDLVLTGAISATDDSDGRHASDFNGLGTMIVAHDYAKVVVDAMKIDTRGFARAAFISDTHGQVLVKNTTVTTLGANPLTQAYKGYTNSADTNRMISPPWVLGIQGGIRSANMLGEKSTLTLIDSEVSSGGWALLSTDGCSSPMMNVVDTTMEILPASRGGMSSGNFSYSDRYGSGYGTYLIGNAVQHFYGATIQGTTYASILTGGYAYFMSSRGQIALKDADGEPIETVTGKGKPTTIHSVFGFMSHNQGSISVLDGTVVNSEEAIFLNKASGAIFVADNAVLNSASGVILQMIDNDDRTVGGGMGGFNTEFNEAVGWPSENGNVTPAGASTAGQGGPGGSGAPGAGLDGRQGGMPEGMLPEGGMPGGAGAGLGRMPGAEGAPGGSGPPGPAAGGEQGGMPGAEGSGGPPGMGGSGGSSGYSDVKLALRNGDYRGDVYNGSGYYSQTGNALDVSIGKDATLTGAISLTETRHVDESGEQNTHFTINEYYYLGHVANRNYRNETATVSVRLHDGGRWIVTGESLLSKLSVCCEDAIEGADGARVVMTIGGRETAIETGRVYSGDIVISLAR